MVALTPLGNLPYPQPADNADIPVHLQSLAEAVDGRTVLRFADAAARDAKVTDPIPGMIAWLNNPGRHFYFTTGKLWAPLSLGPAHWSSTLSGTTTSTSYVETLTGATEPFAFTFLAPPYGVAVLTVGARFNNSAAGLAYFSASVKQGTRVVTAAADSRAAVVGGTNQVTASMQIPMTGLTPGAAYTVTGAYRTTAGTLTLSNRYLTITSLI
ncbi:hypothetical protein DEJ48_20375 [Streptomyces venezuelae]|uniref:Uncharacterized protein n=1 Tax=Streptomyces venezuelae TaxID=54571 RepID=A0A5P2BY90_STRVZ|nr:hypothetical protein [Streptomyces venezuelae]QES35472.1 hypothetical protein DEJ48_20375 [Streptomyces venezuelae]